MSARSTFRGARRGLAVAVLAAALALAVGAAPARAQGAPGDSLLQRWFGAISDSTDAYFGLSAQRADTTGLDSAEVDLLAHPGQGPRVRGPRVAFGPAFAFNRAVGVMAGGTATLPLGRRLGRVTGMLQWANGPNDWYGGGAYGLRRLHDDGERGWTLDVGAGRRMGALNRDYFNAAYATAAALVSGSDRHSYLRRDGARAEFGWRTPAWRASAAYRNELESPLVTTATWNLSNATPVVVANAPAAFGRASETRVWASAKLPWAPFTVEGSAWNAGGALGGDLSYHRWRVAAGGGLALGRHVALAPQVEYGRLSGSAPPQERFYVGGQYSLVTVDAQSLQGTGRAVARADLLVHDDLLELLRLRRNAAFPIQAGAFAGTAARWGYDPATGVARLTRRDWPGSEQWQSEAGVSLMYRPGLPDPETFIRVDYAWPIGAHDRDATLYVSYKRTLHLLRGE